MDIASLIGGSGPAAMLEEYLLGAGDEALFHIDVYGLADSRGVSRSEMIGLMLAGVHEGIFELEWEYHCPYCGGVAHESLSIHDAHEEDFCGVCQVNFSNTLDDNVEVFFSATDRLRKLPDRLKKSYARGIMDDIVRNKMHAWRRPGTIPGIDVINHPLFRSFFEGETLLPDQSLRVKKSTVLFTDIKESTKMYERLGDSRAFRLVREHFKILFGVIERNGGVAIKTIGDAVMGVFTDEHGALRASFESRRELAAYYRELPEGERIEVKIGIHTGPAIVVTLNGRLDYFGTTVNMAARIQALARPGEIVFSEAVYVVPGARKVIAAYTGRLSRSKTTLKGLSGDYAFYRAASKDGHLAA